MSLPENKTNFISYGYIYGKHEDCPIEGHLIVEYLYEEDGPVEKTRMVANCISFEAAIAAGRLFGGTLLMN